MRITRSMNRMLLVAFISLGFVLTSLAADEEKIDGLINIDFPGAGEAKVEVNLAGALFSLAAKAVGKDDPETAELLANLKAIKVRIYDEAALGGKTFDEVMSFYKEQLQKAKWEILAKVKDKESTVGVYSLTEKDVVSGLVVLVRNAKEFIVVNLAGNIDLAKLSEIDEITGFDLNLPDNLDFKKRTKLSPKKEETQRSQRERAIVDFFGGKHDDAIAILEGLEKDGMSDLADYALMAVLQQSKGAKDKSYYYLGKVYEMQDLEDFATAFHGMAVRINPEIDAAEKPGEE